MASKTKENSLKIRHYIGVFVILTQVACGGSSGDPTAGGQPPGGPTLINADLTGTYHVAAQQFDVNANTTEVWSWTGDFNFDGNGNCSYTGTNEVGVKSHELLSPRTVEKKVGAADSNSCRYSYYSDGSLTFGGNEKYFVSSDKKTIIGFPYVNTIETLVRKSNQNLSNATLNGVYLLSSQTTFFTPTSTEDKGVVATVTFDGNGACSYAETSSFTQIRSEDVMPYVVASQQDPLASANCVYTVAADGALSINGNSTYVIRDDGNLIVGIDTTGITDRVSASYLAMVKQSSGGLNNASIQGVYKLLAMSLELYPSNTEGWIWAGNVSFDGNGACSFEGTDVEGAKRVEFVTPRPLTYVSETPLNNTCTYSLAADGTLSLNGEATYMVDPDTNAIVGVVNQVENTFRATYFNRMVRTPSTP